MIHPGARLRARDRIEGAELSQSAPFGILARGTYGGGTTAVLSSFYDGSMAVKAKA